VGTNIITSYIGFAFNSSYTTRHG